jgi:hypothetical protein
MGFGFRSRTVQTPDVILSETPVSSTTGTSFQLVYSNTDRDP